MAPNPSIGISISHDSMEAALLLPAGFKDALSAEELREAVADAGIVLPVRDVVIAALLAAHARGENISGKLLVRGEPAVAARAAGLTFTGDATFPVFPGDIIARLDPGSPGREGRDLFGGILKPEAAIPRPVPKISPDSGVTKVGDQFFALRHGLVLVEDERLYIRELFQISPDNMELRGTVFARDFSGEAVTVPRVRQAFLAMGVTLPPCLLHLERALSASRAKEQPERDVLLACSLNPRTGQDGYLDMRVLDKRARSGLTDAYGRIDYRQRGLLPTVAKGALIAAYVDPTPGHSGRTLNNKIIPNSPGRHQPFKAGPNVILAADKHSFYAEVDGLLLMQDNTLSVSEVYYVQGNVDMRTGNLEMERGSIHIKGSVVAGFRLDCPGSIVVENTVEDAFLTAGGDIEIAGGLVMGGKGLVRAGGNVICLFASKARIDAEGDVSVVNELVNCQVLADGNVAVSGGNGKIIGGVVQAGESISALEVGTAFGSRTIIHLGLDEGFLYKKNQEATRLLSSLRALENKLGPGDANAILERFPQDQQDSIAKLIHSRNILSGRLKRLEERIVRCREKVSANTPCTLKVLGVIHPGTVIHCLGKNMTIRSPLEFSQVSFDPKRKQFLVAPLQSPKRQG